VVSQAHTEEMKMFINSILLTILFVNIVIVTDAVLVDPSPIITTSSILAFSDGQPNGIDISRCPLQNAVPSLNSSTSSLPPLSSGLTLKYVALGRGSQNYTCLSNDSSATPSAVGAVATLFDASCLAGNYPDILNYIPPAFLNVPLDAAVSVAMALGQISNCSLIIGNHYFVDTTTPLFDFRQYGQSEWMEGVKEASVAAPASFSDSGSIPWLKLGYKAGVGIKVSLLYLFDLVSRYKHILLVSLLKC
jgi:hypothetical protein